MTTNIVANIAGLVHAKVRQFNKVVAAVGTPEPLTRRTVSSLTHAGRTVTATTSVNHEFLTGDMVVHSGANQTEYNISAVITVLTATTYTYQLASEADNPVSPATTGGAISADGELWFRTATLTGDKAPRTPNTSEAWMGPNSTNDSQMMRLSPGGEVVIPAPVGTKQSLRDYYLDVGTAADGAMILFRLLVLLALVWLGVTPALAQETRRYSFYERSSGLGDAYNPGWYYNGYPIFATRVDNGAGTKALYFGHISTDLTRVWDAISFNVSAQELGGVNPRYTFQFINIGGQEGMKLEEVSQSNFRMFFFDFNGLEIDFAQTAFGSVVYGDLQVFNEFEGLYSLFRSNLVAQAGFVTSPVTVNLTADNQTVSTTNRCYIRLSSDNATAANRTFVLTPPGPATFAGAILTLEWTHATNQGELADDSANVPSGNNRLSAIWSLGASGVNDTLSLRFNGTDWLETGRSVN